jgi:hypothetical protein
VCNEALVKVSIQSRPQPCHDLRCMRVMPLHEARVAEAANAFAGWSRVNA